MSLNSLLKFIYLLEVDWFINNEKYRSPNRVFLPPSAPTLNFGIMKNIMKRKNTVVKKMTPNIPFDPSNLTNKDFASLKLGIYEHFI